MQKVQHVNNNAAAHGDCRLKFSTPRLRRHVHKHYSHAAVNRKRKLESLPAPPELKIYDFIQNLNNTSRRSAAAATATAAGSTAAAGSSGQQQPSAAKRRVTPLESLKVRYPVFVHKISRMLLGNKQILLSSFTTKTDTI